jgi:hypothetical protein
MKCYVESFGPTRENPEEVEVSYSQQPSWRISSRDSAQAEIRILEELAVHVGLHRCEFSIEELHDGKFAIVCLAHENSLTHSVGTSHDNV